MLQRNDVDASVETRVAKGQRRQIGDSIQFAVIPGRIAHREINSDVSLPSEIFGVRLLARASVQRARAGSEAGRKLLESLLDGGFEMQQIAPQKSGQAALDGPISQAFLRASTIMVDPAPQAASSSVNGSAATTSAK